MTRRGAPLSVSSSPYPGLSSLRRLLFLRLHPRGQSVGRTNFRPVCSPLADLGPFRTQPAHPRLLPGLFHRGCAIAPAPGAKRRGLLGLSHRGSAAKPRPEELLEGLPPCSWGIRSAGRIRARESSSPDSSCKQKAQVLLPPSVSPTPTPTRTRRNSFRQKCNK